MEDIGFIGIQLYICIYICGNGLYISLEKLKPGGTGFSELTHPSSKLFPSGKTHSLLFTHEKL